MFSNKVKSAACKEIESREQLAGSGRLPAGSGVSKKIAGNRAFVIELLFGNRLF